MVGACSPQAANSPIRAGVLGAGILASRAAAVAVNLCKCVVGSEGVGIVSTQQLNTITAHSWLFSVKQDINQCVLTQLL